MQQKFGRSILSSLMALCVLTGVAMAQQPKAGGTLKIAFESDVPGVNHPTAQAGGLC